jgi:hypothetical protein
MRAALILIVFFYLACVSAAASDNYYHDRCRSAFDENPEAKADADKAKPLVMAVFGDSIRGQAEKFFLTSPSIAPTISQNKAVINS